jgi:hypothetical protein
MSAEVNNINGVRNAAQLQPRQLPKCNPQSARIRSLPRRISVTAVPKRSHQAV